MAIYYVSPYTTSNGTGTWASPYSTASSTRATLAAGDEIRVVSKLLTDLLAATVYTATYTDFRTLTITAGGGLVADFVAGTVVYLPEYDTFFKVTSVTANAITVGTSSCLPWYNTVAGQTAITVRRVASAQLPLTLSSNYIWDTMRADVTITDGWTADGTRVTDGTAKSVITASATSVTVFIDTTGNTAVTRTGAVIDLEETHCLPGTSTSGSVLVYMSSREATYTLGQIYSNSSGNALQMGSASSVFSGGSVTIKHMCAYNPLTVLYAFGTTFNFNRVAMRYGDFITYTGSSTSPLPMCKCTVNFGDLVCGGFGSGGQWFYGNYTPPNTFNFNGYFDQYANSSASGIAGAFGDYQLNFGAAFAYYANRRGTTTTSIANKFFASSGQQGSAVLSTPTVATPPGVTISLAYTNLAGPASLSALGLADGQLLKQPNLVRFDCAVPVDNVARYPVGYTRQINLLVTARDGSAPFEILGINAAPLTLSGSATGFPIVSSDASTFRTAAPSLRALLTSRNSTYWPSQARAIKNIKIPMVQGQTYTVTGYIRTDQTGYLLGDCRMSIVFNNSEVVGQDMTTSCVSAWEQFSLNFTASQTGEAVLAWEMYFSAGGRSYWLDDLVIL